MTRLVAAAFAVLLLLTACTDAVGGTGRAKPPSTTAEVAASPSPTLTAMDLLDLVVPVPAGATGSTDPWAANSTPTINQFAAVQYAPGEAAAAATALQAAGVAAIAHRAWYVAKGASADDVLLLFTTPAQATAWHDQLVATARATTGYTAVASIGGMPGWTAAAPNQDGDVVTVFYGVVGAIGVLVDYWTPGGYDPAAAQTWLPPQVAKLR